MDAHIVKFQKLVRALISRVLFERRDARLLNTSSYFDKEWYARHYPDAAGTPPVLHYLRHGAAEGRDPSARFSTSHYLAAYPEVRDCGINPLVHYLRYGFASGLHPLGTKGGGAEAAEDMRLLRRSALFDPDWYVKSYPDAAGEDPYTHFIEVGDAEGRRPGERFSGVWYMTQYLDVRQSGKGPFLHYLRKGEAEGRAVGLTQSQREAILETIRDVEPYDPEFQACEAVHQDPDTLRTNHFFTPLYLSNAWSAIFARLHSDIRVIIFTSGITRGTGDDMEARDFARAAIEQYGASAVLVFLTEGTERSPFTGVAEMDQILALDDYYSEASATERRRMVETLIFALLPVAVVNVGSRPCWDAVAERGKALASFTKIYCCLSPSDLQTTRGSQRVIHTHFRRCIWHLTRLYVPSIEAQSRLVEMYGPTSLLTNRIHIVPLVGNTSTSSNGTWRRFVDALQAAPSFLMENNS